MQWQFVLFLNSPISNTLKIECLATMDFFSVETAGVIKINGCLPELLL